MYMTGYSKLSGYISINICITSTVCLSATLILMTLFISPDHHSVFLLLSNHVCTWAKWTVFLIIKRILIYTLCVLCVCPDDCFSHFANFFPICLICLYLLHSSFMFFGGLFVFSSFYHFVCFQRMSVSCPLFQLFVSKCLSVYRYLSSFWLTASLSVCNC